MSSVNVPQYVRVALQTDQWIQNGKFFTPDAHVMTFLQEEANRIAAYRIKSWQFFSPLDAIPAAAGLGSRQRWRFAFHSSPLCSFYWCRFVMAPGDATNPVGHVGFSHAGVSLETAEANFNYGNTPGPDTPNWLGVGTSPTNDGNVIVQLTPDTDYEAQIVDFDNARIQSVSIWEVTLPRDTDNGYLQSGVVAGGPIMDDQRAALVTLLRELWKEQGAPLLTFASDTDDTAPARGDATPANLIDPTFTGAPTASSPGAFLQLAYHSTIRRGTVPCVFKVYAACAPAGTGHVYLTDAAGTDLADIWITSSTPQWWTTTVDLPATDAKYDLRFAGGGVTLFGLEVVSVYAVSLYQYED